MRSLAGWYGRHGGYWADEYSQWGAAATLGSLGVHPAAAAGGGGGGGWGAWLQDFLGAAAAYYISQDQAEDAIERYEAWIAAGQPAQLAPNAPDTTPTWQLVAYGVGASALVVGAVMLWRRRPVVTVRRRGK